MSFVGILIIQFFALLIPGPDFFLVSRTGITGNVIDVCKVVSGICVGAFIWMVLSILGLHILFQTYPMINAFVMLGGGCYLIYLAYGIVRRNSQAEEHFDFKEKYLFLKGLMCNLSNPKAIIYFASVFSVLPLGSGIMYTLVIVALILIESFLCFLGLGVVFSHPAIKKGYQQYTKKIDFISALIFVFFALLLFLKFITSIDG